MDLDRTGADYERPVVVAAVGLALHTAQIFFRGLSPVLGLLVVVVDAVEKSDLRGCREERRDQVKMMLGR